MPEIPINIIKGDSIGVETDYRDALPVNMYAVERDILGAKGYMIEYPGLTSLGTGSGKDRGGHYNERLGNQYRVSGGSFISVSAAGAKSVIGSVSGTGQVAMPYSFNTQAVIADGQYYLYDSSEGFRRVDDGDLGSPIDCVWVDGYYFFTDGEYIYHTDLSDESAIDPLKYATAEFMPDPSLGVAKTQDNKVLVFGRYSLEYFVDVAQDNFAFQRIVTRAQKIGIVATHAKTEAGGNFYITGGRKDEAVAVHIIGIGSSEKVSTREIDKIISQYTEPELSDMRMESRQENDVTFVLVHLPNETLCFNETIANVFGKQYAWSILKSDVQGDSSYRAINGVFDARSAKWVYGDKIDSTIGLLDNNVATHYGEIAEWILPTPFVNLESFSIDKLELETIPGHTTTKDATVAVSFTVDGLTYGTEAWLEYGSPKDYGKRFIKRRCGYVSDWIGFKFRGASRSRMAFAMFKVTYA